MPFTLGGKWHRNHFYLHIFFFFWMIKKQYGILRMKLYFLVTHAPVIFILRKKFFQCTLTLMSFKICMTLYYRTQTFTEECLNWKLMQDLRSKAFGEYQLWILSTFTVWKSSSDILVNISVTFNSSCSSKVIL